MKTVSIFLALLNSLFAGFLILLDLSYGGINQSVLWWSALKLSTAASIIVIGMLTWLGAMGAVQPSLIQLGSVFLIALGPATIMWALHLALTTGDMEYHMAIFSASLMIQGAASLVGFAGGSRGIIVS